MTRVKELDPRSLAIGLAGIRIGIGGALVLAPQVSARLWIGPGTAGAGTRVLARALGARDVVLGYRTLQAARSGEATAGWLELGAMADAADVVAALIAHPRIPGHRRLTMPLVAAAMGASCAWVARQRPGSIEDAVDDIAPDGADLDGGGDGAVEDLGAVEGQGAVEDLGDEEVDDDTAAGLLEVTVDRIDVLVADGVIVPVSTDPRRFRRSEVIAVRLSGG